MTESLWVPKTHPCALAWGFVGCGLGTAALEEFLIFDLLISGMLISRHDGSFDSHRSALLLCRLAGRRVWALSPVEQPW